MKEIDAIESSGKEWTSAAYESEFKLQEVIETQPEIIPVKALGKSSQLEIVGRETSTPFDKFIDHLAVDEEGNIYVIEYKLCKNHEMRSVIAQVLEYCAQLSHLYSLEAFLECCGTKLEKISFYQDEEKRKTFEKGLERSVLSQDYKALIITDRVEGSQQALANRATVDYLREVLEIYLIEVSKFTSAGESLYVPIITAGGPHVQSSEQKRRKKVRIWEKLFTADHSHDLEIVACFNKYIAWLEEVQPDELQVTEAEALSLPWQGWKGANLAYVRKPKDSCFYGLYVQRKPPEGLATEEEWDKILGNHIGIRKKKEFIKLESAEVFSSYVKMVKELYNFAKKRAESDPS